MKRILLASHGRLALGLKDSLEIFLGKSDLIVAVGAYIDSTDNYIQEIQQFIDSVEDDDAVIFTDIYGGSVNQQVTKMVLTANKKIPIITSMNMPIVLAVALSEKEMTSTVINQLCVDCIPKMVVLPINEEKRGDMDEFFG
jgi:PTS system mannose-specific IIA component